MLWWNRLVSFFVIQFVLADCCNIVCIIMSASFLLR
jgi:hypothetical protein